MGPHGRRGLVSLEALDAAFFGSVDTPWTEAADRLLADGWLSQGDANRLALLWWFGTLIGNTDMHYGNISLFLDESYPLELAPTYDMVPMRYRPDLEGSFAADPIVPAPPPQAGAMWVRAGELAARFWVSLARHGRVTPAFRTLATQNAQAVFNAPGRVQLSEK